MNSEYWTLECEKCGESFISRGAYNKHLWDAHQINVNFKTGGMVNGVLLIEEKAPEVIAPDKYNLWNK